MSQQPNTEPAVSAAVPSVPRELADRKYVDDRDLARLTPISREQWQNLRYKKEGPPWRKLGRRVVYRWDDVVAWIEAQPSGGGS